MKLILLLTGLLYSSQAFVIPSAPKGGETRISSCFTASTITSTITSATTRKNTLLTMSKKNSENQSNIDNNIDNTNRNIDGIQTKQQINRKKFIHQTLLATAASLLINIPSYEYSNTYKANAFEGGVGGLGKTKPSTGVVFANPDNVENAAPISTPGDYNAELLSPDGTTPAFLSFYAPWPMLKSSGIESRDLANSESAFVQVVPLPLSSTTGKSLSVTNLPKSFFVNSIFGQTGKYGAYGTPTDIKVSKVRDGESSSIYTATFTTLTPSMRESDRKVIIAATEVGGGIFMLVTGTTLTRFKSQGALLNKVVDSFVCVEAPKSSLRR